MRASYWTASPLLPAVLLEVVRDAADGVGRAVAQVGHAVAVEVDRVPEIAAGHELGNADRARVRALDREHVDPRLAREQQIVRQFPAEEIGARRIVEGERGERVDHAPAAGVAAVVGFHANDRDDVFLRHAVDAPRARQHVAVARPELDPGADALRVDEDTAVDLPGLVGLGGGRLNGIEHRLLALCARKQLPQLARVERVLLYHLPDEGPHLGPTRIGRGLGRRSLCRGGEAEREESGAESFHDSRKSRTRRLSSSMRAGGAAAP